MSFFRQLISLNHYQSSICMLSTHRGKDIVDGEDIASSCILNITALNTSSQYDLSIHPLHLNTPLLIPSHPPFFSPLLIPSHPPFFSPLLIPSHPSSHPSSPTPAHPPLLTPLLTHPSSHAFPRIRCWQRFRGSSCLRKDQRFTVHVLRRICEITRVGFTLFRD